MQFPRPAGLVAGLTCLAALAAGAPPAVAQAPANVTIRVEGASGTLIEESAVRTRLAPVTGERP